MLVYVMDLLLAKTDRALQWIEILGFKYYFIEKIHVFVWIVYMYVLWSLLGGYSLLLSRIPFVVLKCCMLWYACF